jgi:hypothetical protein
MNTRNPEPDPPSHATPTLSVGPSVAGTVTAVPDPNAPPNAYPLFALWDQFGRSITLHNHEWDQLKPVLDRLPSLDLINPHLDQGLAADVIDRHLREHGAQPRPVRWFADARSARAHAPAVRFMAEPVFPCKSFGAPSAFGDVWHAADSLFKNDVLTWGRTHSQMAAELEHARVPPIGSLSALLEMFAAGVFYYWIGPEEVVCIARPSLWLVRGRLHRADGPAVEWPTGERYFFWNGIEVPSWIIESPERITPKCIRSETISAVRRCMMERFGMERFTILERWAEWQNCHGRQDFEFFAAAGLRRTFRAVSERITAHAEAVVARLKADQLRKPHFDRIAAQSAMGRFMREWGESVRPLRWFEDGRSARAYVEGKSSQLLRATYWPRLQIARVLDAAWYREGLDPRVRSINVNWLRMMEDWQDWSITAPRALDCNDPVLIEGRVRRMEDWMVAGWGGHSTRDRDKSAADIKALTPCDPAIRRWTPLMDSFAAGLFYYWISSQEVVCVPRPALWIVNDQLDREDGPAVEWPTGERYFFWRGVEVPSWFIERPEQITMELIRGELNLEFRRCMIERFGEARFLVETGAQLVAEDEHGKLWRPKLTQERSHMLLEVKNGTLEPDGTRRLYFLRVPPEMRTPHQAVAWTYGLPPGQYDVAVRT